MNQTDQMREALETALKWDYANGFPMGAIIRQALIQAHRQALAAPPQDAESLGDDLAGVIAEMEAGQPFDKVCLQTLTRVRDSLYLKSRGKE